MRRNETREQQKQNPNWKRARCRLGFEKRVDAAISRSACKAKADSQSSAHSLNAPVNMDDLSGSLIVKGHVRLFA
jgi:hypothetical protein